MRIAQSRPRGSLLREDLDSEDVREKTAPDPGFDPAAVGDSPQEPKARPPKMIFSHSRLSSFESCRLKFHYRYVQRLPAQTEGIEAFVGKRVHEVLERLQLFADRGQLPSIRRVVARYHALWDEHFDAERIRIARQGIPIDFYRRLGVRCLENYYRAHYPFDIGVTLGLEQHVSFSLDEAGEYRMRGIIDRIVRAPDGVIEIQDYKTGARVPSQERLDKDRQLALYQIALSDTYGPDQPMRLVWHYVASGQQRVSTRSPEQLKRLRRNTIKKIDRIAEEREFPAKQSMLCGWCEYRDICPEFAEPEADRKPDRKPAPAYRAPVPLAPTPPPPRQQLELFLPSPA